MEIINRFKNSAIGFVIGLIIISMAVLSCDTQEVELNENTYELAEAMLYDGQLDSSVVAFVHAGRTRMLNLEGEFTVLAPSNAAWYDYVQKDMRIDTMGDFMFNGGLASRIVDLYIIEGVHDWDQLEGASFVTESGDQISINNSTISGAKNGTANIVPDRQIKAFNGFIYEIDKVITGSAYPFLTAYEALAVDSMQTSIFKAMVDQVPDVRDMLNQTNDMKLFYHVLAPKDSAMNAYFEAKGYGTGVEAISNIAADTVDLFVREHVFTSEDEDMEAGDIDNNFETIAGHRVKYDDEWLQDFRTNYDATNGRISVFKTADDDGGSLIDLDLPLPEEGG